MAPLYDGHDYYRKMFELQEKLRKSEEDRIRLEERFNVLARESRNRHDTCVNRLRMRYIQYLEEQRTRDERNHKLLAALDKVTNKLALISAKKDRLNVLRKQYEAYLLRVYANCRPAGSVTGDSGIASQNEDRCPRRTVAAAARPDLARGIASPPFQSIQSRSPKFHDQAPVSGTLPSNSSPTTPPADQLSGQVPVISTPDTRYSPPGDPRVSYAGQIQPDDQFLKQRSVATQYAPFAFQPRDYAPSDVAKLGASMIPETTNVVGPLPDYMDYALRKSEDEESIRSLTSDDVMDDPMKRLSWRNATRSPDENGRATAMLENELDRYIDNIRKLHREHGVQSQEDHEQNTSGDLLNVTLSEDAQELPAEDRVRKEKVEMGRILALASDLASRTADSPRRGSEARRSDADEAAGGRGTDEIREDVATDPVKLENSRENDDLGEAPKEDDASCVDDEARNAAELVTGEESNVDDVFDTAGELAPWDLASVQKSVRELERLDDPEDKERAGEEAAANGAIIESPRGGPPSEVADGETAAAELVRDGKPEDDGRSAEQGYPEGYEEQQNGRYDGYGQSVPYEGVEEYASYAEQGYVEYADGQQYGPNGQQDAQYDPNQAYDYSYEQQYEAGQGYEGDEYTAPYDQTYEGEQGGNPVTVDSEGAPEEVSTGQEGKPEERTDDNVTGQPKEEKKKDVIRSLLDSDTTDTTIERNVSNTESDFDFN
ncbi:PREDICTED: uncharacterized protein LOC106743743 isoform X1 [Dinoponera quadriceps]|uniref:Uncharacterized protein LOC106743743 isoform X1 n=1 Tax=Dinoponera quadriceps TaxID=609295 RepID=A0A6P3X563_DINQU|nr:PREDICTED: uncharacterized protein LOC106743743 isoform X1 [Dinoponera quadriceps]